MPLGWRKGMFQVGRRGTLSGPYVSVSAWVLLGNGVPQPPAIPLPGYEWWGAKPLLQPPRSAWLITVSLRRACAF